MSSKREGLLVRHAEEQHGLFTAAQARAVGLPDDWCRNRLASGRIVRVRYGAYRFAGTPLRWEGELLAAIWAGGARGRASHRAAAQLWGIAGGTTDLLEITCPRFRRARHDHLVVHETKLYVARDTSERNHIPLTTCERTLLDLGAVVLPLTVEQAFDDALRLGHVTIASTRRMLARTAASGRNGVGVLREIVDHRTPGRLPESRQERAMVAMLRRHGLPEPVLQYDAHAPDGRFLGRVDAAYPDEMVLLEYESYEHHTGGVALVRDHARRNAMISQGYRVFGITAPDLRRGGGAGAAAAIRAALQPPLRRR